MKTFIVTLILVISSMVLFGQEPQVPKPECPHMKNHICDSKHEIGIGVANLFQRPPYMYPVYMPYYDPFYYPYNYGQPTLGITYRYHQANGAYRLGLNLFYTMQNWDYQYSENDNSNLLLGISSGYEWNKGFRRMQIFYGADLFINYSQSSSESRDTTVNVYSSENSQLQFGISPLVGLRYYILPQVSISTETQFRVSRFESEYTTKYINNTTKSNSDGFSMGFTPFGLLSLNLHF